MLAGAPGKAVASTVEVAVLLQHELQRPPAVLPLVLSKLFQRLQHAIQRISMAEISRVTFGICNESVAPPPAARSKLPLHVLCHGCSKTSIRR